MNAERSICWGKLLLAGAIATSFAAVSHAQGITDLTGIATLNGRCNTLIIGSKDLSSDCTNKLANTTYKTGRTGFTFLLDDYAIVTFSGADSPAVGNRASVSLDRVLISKVGSGEEPETLRATGTCSYTNPYAGPSHINCRAFTKLGTIQSSFVSDGREPELKRFD